MKRIDGTIFWEVSNVSIIDGSLRNEAVRTININIEIRLTINIENRWQHPKNTQKQRNNSWEYPNFSWRAAEVKYFLVEFCFIYLFCSFLFLQICRFLIQEASKNLRTLFNSFILLIHSVDYFIVYFTHFE